jgi:hypothetical protein
MEIIYFTNLDCRRAYRAIYSEFSGRLYVELLAQTDYSPSPTHWEATCEADLGQFGFFDLALLSTIAAGAVELGRAVFYALA